MKTKIIKYINMTSSGSNGGNERDSFWNSLMLKMGEYDIWASEMEAHVISIDA